MTRIYAELSISCKTRNLQELSILTGLYPSGWHDINDISKMGKQFDYSQWDYKTDSVVTYYPEDISPLIMNAFKNCIGNLSKFIKKNNCRVSICYVIDGITETIPDLTIDREMIKFAAKLNAKIYFDGLGTLAAYLTNKENM
jgi:hypothetical protein